MVSELPVGLATGKSESLFVVCRCETGSLGGRAAFTSAGDGALTAGGGTASARGAGKAAAAESPEGFGEAPEGLGVNPEGFGETSEGLGETAARAGGPPAISARDAGTGIRTRSPRAAACWLVQPLAANSLAKLTPLAAATPARVSPRRSRWLPSFFWARKRWFDGRRAQPAAISDSGGVPGSRSRFPPC